jgi:hypothetical protein
LPHTSFYVYYEHDNNVVFFYSEEAGMGELKFLKSRAELCFRLFMKHHTDRLLWYWLRAEQNLVSAEGAVDVKVTLFPNEQTATPDAVLTVANALRLRRVGELRPAMLH